MAGPINNIVKTFVYTGPSWAELSYEPEENFDQWPNYTNLALEWNLPCENTARRGYHNFNCIDQVRQHDGPAIWVMCEPLVAILHNGPLQRHYLRSQDHLSFRQTLLIQQLEAIQKLGRPVGIIGAHSDIRPSDLEGFTNLHIIDASWQNFLAGLTNIEQRHYNWGYEIAHVIMQANTDVKPHSNLINDTYEGLEFWKELEKKKVFCDVHPNRLGNIEFAKHTKDQLVKFLNECP